MEPGKVNLTISKKASFEYTFYVLDSYDKTKLPNDPSQDAVDLTGCTGTALIKDKIGGTTIVSLTVSFPTPLRGECKLSLTNTQTTSLSFKSPAVWDILITFPSTKVVKYLEGNVFLDLTAS